MQERRQQKPGEEVKPTCAGTDNDFRYERSGSMTATSPNDRAPRRAAGSIPTSRATRSAATSPMLAKVSLTASAKD
ncbi:unnamed protein product [Phytophthora fragariaefolia]|uniref:Unnamed protein product n=1 Tax=Phytophthora fragariaefolia TaxID=1490495 RepID=A0A9W7CIM1_9STRA|nr:unnamed protein product [Phytophthora fragariaefolia]